MQQRFHVLLTIVLFKRIYDVNKLSIMFDIVGLLQLEQNYGNEIMHLNPPLEFVPWLVLNNQPIGNVGPLSSLSDPSFFHLPLFFRPSLSLNQT